MKADYVIVGGGSAGCVLAARLSEDPAVSVILIEAGGNGRDFLVSMPAGYGRTVKQFGHSWHYHSAPEPGLGGRTMLVPRGRGLGGSSNINGLIYVRGQAEDYDSWSNLGAIGWGWADVAPLFRRAEHFAGGGSDLRGGSGPLRVEEVVHRDPTNDAVLAGFAELGVPATADYNGADQHGAFYYQTTIHDGRRCSAADAYLRPVLKRPNLTVLTGHLARRVVLEGRRAVGVEVAGPGGNQTVSAAREVILAAGAYHSPKLLMLSGIGPAADLAAKGIVPVHDSPEVGANLQDHFILTMCWRLRDNAFSFNRELSGFGLVRNMINYLVRRRGAMTIPAAQTGAFVKSDPVLDRPDLQFHCLPVSGDLGAAADGGDVSLSPWPGLTLAPCVLRPESRGHVRLASADPEAVPHIVHNYLTAEHDCRLSVQAMRLARALAATAPLAALGAVEQWPGDQCASDAALLDHARRYGNTGYHPVGTCRMGIDDTAVLDPQLRVRGVTGLRVADASVMPRLVSGNTNAAAIMIGEKAADLLRAR